jgi:hypothetical protein
VGASTRSYPSSSSIVGAWRFFRKGTIRQARELADQKDAAGPKVEDEDEDEYDSLLHATPLFSGFFSAIAAYLV